MFALIATGFTGVRGKYLADNSLRCKKSCYYEYNVDNFQEEQYILYIILFQFVRLTRRMMQAFSPEEECHRGKAGDHRHI
jgi:hypothetical protein